MDSRETEELLAEQRAYYGARAGEYDQWWLRQGRYDRGAELNRRWFAETEALADALRSFAPKGRVLELACGTGNWTRLLAESADHLTAVDASPEMLAIARERAGTSNVEYKEADLFSWCPDAEYDVVFFGFWLSHVPPDRFEPFWNTMRSCFVPGGRVFFADSLPDETATATDQRMEGRQSVTSHRQLNSGNEYRVVKVFYEPDELQARLTKLGWRIQVHTTGSYFLYGLGGLSE
jgi:ubiquinone/menaquinone biosynthesis C-methylase UbiE